jgi:hypothetical protein
MSYKVLKKYDHGGVHPDVKELLGVMNKMTSSPKTDRKGFKDGTTPLSYEDQNLNARDFLQKWMNSSRGMEMLKTSYGDDWESAFVNRHRNTQQAKIAHVDKFNELYKDPETGDMLSDEIITSGRRWGDAGPLGGSGYHKESSGSPFVMGPQSIRDRGVIRVKDTVDPDDKVLVHELSHSSDALFPTTGKLSALNRSIPLSDSNLMGALSDRDSYSKMGYRGYVARDTETRARLASIRSKAEDLGHDIFNQEFTMDMLNQKDMLKGGTSLKDGSFYKQLRRVYSEEEILKLLNTVS